MIIALPEVVVFFDVLAWRGGKEDRTQDLELQHDEFISFLKDFKEFLKQNN